VSSRSPPAPHFCPCQVTRRRQRLPLLCCETGAGSSVRPCPLPWREGGGCQGPWCGVVLWQPSPGSSFARRCRCVSAWLRCRASSFTSAFSSHERETKKLSFAVSPGNSDFSSANARRFSTATGTPAFPTEYKLFLNVSSSAPQATFGAQVPQTELRHHI